MDLVHEGDDLVCIGPATKTAGQYLVKLEVGGLTGVIASLIGKDPPEKKVEGAGLDLALSRKFVELPGGRIWVKSEVGMSSTFTFTIPVRRVA